MEGWVEAGTGSTRRVRAQRSCIGLQVFVCMRKRAEVLQCEKMGPCPCERTVSLLKASGEKKIMKNSYFLQKDMAVLEGP